MWWPAASRSSPEKAEVRFSSASGTSTPATCLKAGFDLARDLVPVGPAAHYVMGGVETDLEGRTSIPGLFAAGEVACTRVHGANRLASNSLLEGLVFGARAGRAMAGPAREAELPPAVFRQTAAMAAHCATHEMSEQEIRELMWSSVGLFRERSGLSDAFNVLHG